MAFLRVNPRYQQLLGEQGLVAPQHFLEIPAVIICGHPDRNVARVTLATGTGTFSAFLKREHRVPWIDRLRNAIAGFGFVSKSSREASILGNLQQAGVPCPDWIAVGEDGQGRAFLLLREVPATRDLRLFLQDYGYAPEDQRRRFAHRLGTALADFHNAGFDHFDLYSKHVLVNSDGQTISLLDWQRSRRRRRVTWRRRCRDLAALEATLAEDLVTVRERLVCLRAYLEKSTPHGGKCKTGLRSSALYIRRLAGQLLRQRRIREMCRIPAASGGQGLIWQDGEALCLTPDFQADLAGHIPVWLVLAKLGPQPGSWETRTWVHLPGDRRALLIHRRQRHLLGGLWAFFRRRPLASPELRRAGLLFRLERYGIRACRLLAFGQRTVSCWRVDSFLLVEPSPEAMSLGEWLAHCSAELGPRRHLIREAAGVLRRIHDLHCYLGGQCSFAVIQPDPKRTAKVVLADMGGLHSRRRPNNREGWKDLAALHSEMSSAAASRTDALRFLLSYLGQRTLSAAAKQSVRALLSHRSSAAVKRVLDRLQPADGFPLRTAEQGALP